MTTALPKYILDTPHFAPDYTYRKKNYLSPLDIIKEKGCLKLNPDSFNIINHPDFLFCPPPILIDKEIKRVSYPWKYQRNIIDQATFISSIATAMTKDAENMEKMFPDHTILALVGGKDSMNMLLLPWKNPVIVASAEPNYPLVKAFLADNDLKYDIIKLEDEKNLDLEREIRINCCRLNLEHCRWSGHLKEIVDRLERKTIIIKGQGGDNFFTHKWRMNLYPPPEFHITGLIDRVTSTFKSKLYNLRLSAPIKFDNQKLFFYNLWYESAHWQGVHMSFLHEYTAAPVLSMYHNSNVMNIITSTDFEKVVNSDLRNQIGEKIFGHSVSYPETNPAPPSSRIRKGICETKPFLEQIRKMKIRII